MYALICTASNHFYIGATSNLRRRLQEHKRQLPRGMHACKRFVKRFDQHFEMLTLADAQDVWSARQIETYFIWRFDATNRKRGGGNSSWGLGDTGIRL